MTVHGIGKKITQACPSIYLAGAKIGKPVYWARRILAMDCERTGKKIARLHEKYGDAVVEKTPQDAEASYHAAEKYAPGAWKAHLKSKEALALVAEADIYESRAEYFEGMHTRFFREDVQESDSLTPEMDETINRGSRIAVRREQAYLLGVAAECLRLVGAIYQSTGKAAHSVLERAYSDVDRAEFILKVNIDFKPGEGFTTVSAGLGTFRVVTVEEVSNLKRAVKEMLEEERAR